MISKMHNFRVLWVFLSVALLIGVVVLIVFLFMRAAPDIVTSDDGRVTLTIPKSALPEDVDAASISVVASTEPEGTVGPEGSWYELQPDGLTFNTPISVAFASDVDPRRPGVNVVAVFHIGASGAFELVDGTATTFDLETGTMKTEVHITHFSRLVFAREGLLNIAAVIPPPTPVGDTAAINTIVTQEFGDAMFPPDWGTPAISANPDSSPEVLELFAELERESDWIRRMQTFTIPGQGRIGFATVDYTGTLEEIGGPVLTPTGLIENRPYRSAMTAARYEKDRWQKTRTFSDFTCAKKGTTQVAWRITWHGFSSRSDVSWDIPTTLVTGMFQVNIPISCGDAPVQPSVGCVEGDSGQIVKEVGAMRICVTPPSGPIDIGDPVVVAADIEGRWGEPFGLPDQPEYFNMMLYDYPRHGQTFANVIEVEGDLTEQSAQDLLHPVSIISNRPGKSEIKVIVDVRAHAQPPSIPTVTSRDFVCEDPGKTTLLWQFSYEAFSSREYTEDDVVQIQDKVGVEIPVECVDPAGGIEDEEEECQADEGGFLKTLKECQNACKSVPDSYGGCNCDAVDDAPGCYIMRLGPAYEN